jgi:endonuclease/exonuclease/phosphatase family metal-dependent hydrolase
MLRFLKSIFKISLIFKVGTVLCLFSLVLAYLSPFVHPNKLWIIPFFGLAYPIIILVTFVFLVIWAIAKSRWFFVVLFFILIGGGLHFRFYSTPFGKDKNVPENALKVLSYNVRNFNVFAVTTNKDYTDRDSIFNFVQREHADIVCFQEFYAQDDVEKFPTKDTLHKILKASFYHDRMTFNNTYKNYYGISIYSKFPMITKGHINFDDSIKTTNNFCIFADIVRQKDTFRVYNAHFQSIKFQQDDYKLFGDSMEAGVQKSTAKLMLKRLKVAYHKRADQGLKVLEHMQQSPYPVILCGDFNDTPLSYIYNLFYGKYLDAFRNCSSGIGVTYAGKIPAGRIDYIFHSDIFESGSFEIQKGVFSDHKAISCKIWKK